MKSLPRLIAIAVGVLMIGLGAWALVDPQSFYEQIAAFPPYNKHLFHDVGAFQVGIGSALVLAVFIGDALLLALAAGAIGSILHAVSHVIDRDLGGRTTDPWGLGLLALILVAGALIRAREVRL
jgi:hypothetical protein